MKHSLPSKRIEFKLLFHSHKEVDKVVFALLSDGNDFNFEYLDLAKSCITPSLLIELSQKLRDWQVQLLDEHYMDHSIPNPGKEFELFSIEGKLKFLQNNLWTIGTPIVVLENKAIRFMNVEDTRRWIETTREEVIREEELIEY